MDISVNGNPVPIHMKLGDSGEAYFLEECEEDSVATVSTNNSQQSEPPTPSALNAPNSSRQSDGSDKENRSQSEFDFEVDSDNDENEEAKQALVERKPNDPLATPRSSQERNNVQKKVRRKKKNKAAKSESKQQLETNRRACDQDEALLNFDDDTLHPFSDSEISVDNKKIKKLSMDSFDYKSDSEVEMSKQNESPPISHDNISWGWGELPNVSTDISKKELSVVGVNVPAVNDDITPNGSPSSSMLGGVLSFMNREKEKEDENDKGIYLSDLNPDDMNPEVAAKYFPQFRSSSFSSTPVAVANNSSNNSNTSKPLSICTSEDEIESGKGASLSNSPNYAESYMREIECFKNINTFDVVALSKLYHDMSMSLCGGIENLYNNSADSEQFLQSIISFDDFSENPLQFIDNPNLVIRMGGRYYTWKMASSILLSLLMFQRPLPEKAMEDLKNRCVPKKKTPNLGNAKSSWRSWFRSNQTEMNTQIDELDNSSDQHDSTLVSTRNGTANSTSTALNFSHEYISDDETNKMFAGTSSSSGNEQTATTNIGNNKMSNKKKYRKVLRLNSDVIKSLQLQPNSNDIEFSVTTAFQGTTVCQSKIFLWRHDDKVVISDIDGTITRSDVLGHILPIIGNNWAQMGVTNLFTQIENNGYKFLYLSARAIGQAKTTRDYLRSISQDEIVLPDGPVLLSPTSLFSALHR